MANAGLPDSPELITRSARTPRRPHCSATFGTAAGGTQSTARSTGSVSSSTDRWQTTPHTCVACGFTATRRPGKPARITLLSRAWPTESDPRPAPTTITDRGASTASRLWMSARCSRVASASGYPSARARSSSTRTSPPSTDRHTGSPTSVSTCRTRSFSGNTSATNRRTPLRRARDARCSSRSVPTPCSCSPCATASATSAVEGSERVPKHCATPISVSPRNAPSDTSVGPRDLRRSSVAGRTPALKKRRYRSRTGSCR